MERDIIRIDENRCSGCGECIPNCPEGAIQVIDGKARLVSDLFCDGLGACIGHCPEGAITIERREAGTYDERKVVENVIRQGAGTLRAHLEHLREHGEERFLAEALAFCVERGIAVPEDFGCSQRTGHPLHAAAADGCPGSRFMSDNSAAARHLDSDRVASNDGGASRLRQWPVQIMLVPPRAPFLAGADLLVAADCVPFAYADFHRKLLDGKVCLVGCPKLDDARVYEEKLTEMFARNDIRSVTVAHMEVPCCFGMARLVRSAVARSGKRPPLRTCTITVRGECA